MSPVLPLFKVAGLLFRTVAKPIANTVKDGARRNERFRQGCISLANAVNYVEVKMRRWSRDEKGTLSGASVRRLNDEKAVALGANFISETIVFTSACIVLFVEQWRAKKSSQNYKDDVQETIALLKERIDRLEQANPAVLAVALPSHTLSGGAAAAANNNSSATFAALTSPERITLFQRWRTS